MLVETERLIITEFTMDMAQAVQENSVDEDNKKFVPDEMWEIGYHIAKRCTGNGYATEAVKAFLPVIAKIANVTEIYGFCLAENKASDAVMKKCGFINVYSGIGLYQGTERKIIKNVWKI